MTEILLLLIVLIGIAGIVWRNKAKKKEKAKYNSPAAVAERAQRAADETLLQQLLDQYDLAPTEALQLQITALRIKLGYSTDQNG
jgi:hypothetical protein